MKDPKIEATRWWRQAPYVEARYPNAIEDTIPADFYSAKDADGAIDLVRVVIVLVREFLNTP